MLQKLKEFITEKGQGIVEYALILAFVAVIALVFTNSNGLKDQVKSGVQNATNQISAINSEYTPGQ